MSDYTFTLYTKAGNTNLLDPRTVSQGHYIDVNGNIIEATNYAFSALIRVQENTLYSGTAGGNVFQYMAYYDENKRFISGAYVPSWTSFFTTPADTYYVVVSIRSIEDGLNPENASLSVGTGSTFEPFYNTKEVRASFSKLGRTFQAQSKAEYFRDKLEGGFNLVRDDYQYLHSLPFDTKVYLDITDKTGQLSTFKGQFYKTDCEWDEDNYKVSVKVDTADKYTDFLASLDKSYNLIDLAPELEDVEFKRRSVIQVYIIGDSVVTNIVGGTYWEQPINTDPIFDSNTLVNTYKFINSKNVSHIPIGYASGLSTDVTGSYDDSLESDNGMYRVGSTPGGGGFVYHIERISDGAFLYITNVEQNLNGAEFSPAPASGETGSFIFTEYNIYVRLYTDLENIGTPPAATFPVPTDDIVTNTANYSFVYPYDVDDFLIYDQFSVASTRFGKAPEDSANTGQYYKEYLIPSNDPSGLSNPIPVSSTNWKAVSLWYFNTATTRENDFQNTKDLSLRDAFPLDSVIQKLLFASGTGIVHSGISSYSEILYGSTNPLGNFTYLDFDGTGLATTTVNNITHFLTPKSNIISGGEYDQPARKAQVTLGQVLNMLRDVYQIYWHLDNGRLILEHVSWYNNGGTYSAPIIGTDVRNLYNPRNGKSWEHGRNKYNFDKDDMPERFEFGWMDDVSPAFEGQAIEVLSGYVQKGKIEDLKVAIASTDMDFIMANPSEVSKGGFVLLGAVNESGTYKVPFIEYDTGNNQKFIMQNGFLSWRYIHPKYYVSNMPSDRVNINGTDMVLTNNNTRKKKQAIRYPSTGNIDPYQLVRTSQGSGKISKMTIDMSSRMIKSDIAHDTE